MKYIIVFIIKWTRFPVFALGKNKGISLKAHSDRCKKIYNITLGRDKIMSVIAIVEKWTSSSSARNHGEIENLLQTQWNSKFSITQSSRKLPTVINPSAYILNL